MKENYTKEFVPWKLESAGFEFERHGENHDIYRRGFEMEKIPRHKEMNERLARAILRK